MAAYNNRIYTNKLQLELGVSELPLWTSNRVEFRQQYREWQAISIRASRFDCNQAQHTIRHLPMGWVFRTPERVELLVDETAEHRGAVTAVATGILSAISKNERWKKASVTKRHGIEEVTLNMEKPSVRHACMPHHHVSIRSLFSRARLYLGSRKSQPI